MVRYDIRKGVSKIKTKAVLLISAVGIASAGLVGSLALWGSAKAVTPSWDLNGTYNIAFTCTTGCAGTYTHDATISGEDSAGNFSIAGGYPAGGPHQFGWNGTGNTTGNNVTTSVDYSLGAVAHMDMMGTINSGVMSGTWSDNYDGTSTPPNSVTRTGTWTATSGVALPHCLPTGFFRDGINMTARQIGGNVTGTLDATGCNIGVYYGPGTTGTVSSANVFGSNYYGIVVQRAAVDVMNSQVHNIGETPFNGTQHGVGIYYANIAGISNGDCTNSGMTSGTISGNTVTLYQKGGIVASCSNTIISIMNNTITGNGQVNYIAQNGIQVSLGATGDVGQNTVSGNEYTGANGASSGGILVFGGCSNLSFGGPVSTHVNVFQNILTNNDVGIFLVNYDPTCSLNTAIKTQENAHNNTITKNDGVTNVSGWSTGVGYQAGIEDVGNGDNVHNNTISGYPSLGNINSSGVFTGPGVVYQRAIDSTATPTLNAKIHNNTF